MDPKLGRKKNQRNARSHGRTGASAGNEAGDCLSLRLSIQREKRCLPKNPFWPLLSISAKQVQTAGLPIRRKRFSAKISNCPQGSSFDDLQKEENIFDVWFESGCSWYSVMAQAGCPVPVDIYLEGSDQHRGWFQLSLLPALGATGKPPFKAVLTHGFTVDEKGMKQSKSLGNYVNAMEEIEKYGADILRLWVASVNYQEDVRCNDELIGRTQDAYRKIRNTLRYLLGNIDDFDPQQNSVAYKDMLQIDKWAMQQLQKLIAEVIENYESFTFHRVFSLDL